MMDRTRNGRIPRKVNDFFALRFEQAKQLAGILGRVFPAAGSASSRRHIESRIIEALAEIDAIGPR